MAEFEKAEPIIKKIRLHAASLGTSAEKKSYLESVRSTGNHIKVKAEFALANMERFEHEEKDDARVGEFMNAFPNDYIVKSLIKAGITVQVKTALPRVLEVYRKNYGNMEGLSVGRPPITLLELSFVTENAVLKISLQKTMNCETEVAVEHGEHVHRKVEGNDEEKRTLTNLGRNPEEFLKVMDQIPKLREIAEDFTTFLIFCYRIATYKMPVLKEDKNRYSWLHHLDVVFGMTVDSTTKCFRDSGLPDPYFYLNE